jgi:hypothetical protein
VAVKIDLIADVKDVIKGTDKIGDALESVADDLKDVGKEGQKVDDKVSDAFRNMGKDAKAAGDKIGKSVKDGTDKGSEGLKDMKEEAGSTAKESAASFSSIEDAAGALQEVAANAFAGMGPAGMAAGIVAAAGIGLAISALTTNAEKINENKEKMLGLAQTIRDNGGVLTEADYISNMEEYGYAIQDTKEWFEIFQADAVSGFDELRKIAEETSLSTKDIFKGGFGDKDQAKQTLDDVNKRLEILRDRKEAIYNTTGSFLDVVDAEELTSLEKAKTLIEENIKAQEDAAMVEQTRKDSIKGTTEALREDAVAKDAAEENERDLAQYVAGTTEEFKKNASAIEEVTDALKGSITTELDYLDKNEALNKQLAESGNAWDINTAKGRDNRRAVVDMASGIEEMAKAALDSGTPVADVTAKFAAQKSMLVDQVLPAFQGNREAAQAYIDTILKTPPITKTKVELDKAEAEQRLKDLTSPRGIPMHISGVDGTAVENYFMSQQGRKIFVEFAPRGGGQAIALP